MLRTPDGKEYQIDMPADFVEVVRHCLGEDGVYWLEAFVGNAVQNVLDELSESGELVYSEWR